MYVAPQSPQPIGGVIDSAINLFKASFRQCWPAALLYSAISMGLSIWLQTRLRGLAATTSAADALAVIASPAVWGTYLLVILLSIAINLMMTATILDVARNRTGGSALGRFGATLSLLPGALGVMLVVLIGAGVIGGALGLFFAIAGLGGVRGNVLVFLLFVPLGAYFIVRWILWTAAYADRREGAFAALGTSWQLVDGNWWRALAITSVMGAVVLILLLVLGVVTGFFGAATAQDPFTLLVVSAALQAVLQVLYLPAIAATIVATYEDLQLRKKGGDLEARLDSLGTPRS